MPGGSAVSYVGSLNAAFFSRGPPGAYVESPQISRSRSARSTHGELGGANGHPTSCSCAAVVTTVQRVGTSNTDIIRNTKPFNDSRLKTIQAKPPHTHSVNKALEKAATSTVVAFATFHFPKASCAPAATTKYVTINVMTTLAASRKAKSRC